MRQKGNVCYEMFTVCSDVELILSGFDRVLETGFSFWVGNGDLAVFGRTNGRGSVDGRRTALAIFVRSICSNTRCVLWL